MKKFTLIENRELEMGIQVQSEHEDIYLEIKSILDKNNIQVPWTREEFFKKIALKHLEELDDYYSKLKDMEGWGINDLE